MGGWRESEGMSKIGLGWKGIKVQDVIGGDLDRE